MENFQVKKKDYLYQILHKKIFLDQDHTGFLQILEYIEYYKITDYCL